LSGVTDRAADARGERKRAAGSVQSVDRALDLLELLARSDVPMGVGEVAELASLPQGTAHRLLHSLQLRGYVRHDSSRKYSVGTSSLRLADAAQRSLARSSRSYLSHLVSISGETANLAVLEGDDIVYVAQVSSPHTLRMFAEVGRHVPPHSTAVGKVLLAAMPADRALATLKRTGLPRRTAHTITDIDTFVGELSLARERGWAADEEEQETGVRCVAVPVGDGRRVLAAVSVSGPSERFAGSGSPGLVEQMTQIARTFSVEVLGADPARA
jgi:IclR family transcriptional regulator, acetate operon repressor